MPSRARVLAPSPGPDTLVATRWAGARLGPLRGAAPGLAIGESWEFSTLAERTSRVGNEPLTAALARPLPFLAKLIDTALPLSIQVHPPDGEPDERAPAQPALGKEEAWVILAAEPGAHVIAGLAEGHDAASLRAGLAAALARPDDPSPLLATLQTIAVRPGMALLIPAGTVHAIGAGVLLAEIQQPVDRTYRLFDWGSGRPIQPERALALSDARAQPRVWSPGAAAAPLRGAHVELTPVLAGETRPVGAAPTLVIVVEGPCALDGVPVPAADLRLVLAPDVELTVGPGGLAFLGTCDAGDAAHG
jgi:mannose-6-phosphate isomerase class I